MTESMQKIPWNQTLAFKLFMLVSTILFLAIATLSIQNNRQFSDILKQQNEDHLQVTTLAAASSFQNNLDYWSALANSIGHMSARLPMEQLTTATQGLLDSNQGLATVQIISSVAQDSPGQNLFLASRYESADASGKRISDFEKQLRGYGRSFVQKSLDKRNKQRVYFKNISSETKLPLVQIATRTTRVAEKTTAIETDNETWVILSLWQ